MFITRGNLQAAMIYEIDDETEMPKRDGVSVACMFNPYEYTVRKSNTYQEQGQNQTDASSQEFAKAGAQELSLKLTYDTYETGRDVTRTTRRAAEHRVFAVSDRVRVVGGRICRFVRPGRWCR